MSPSMEHLDQGEFVIFSKIIHIYLFITVWGVFLVVAAPKDAQVGQEMSVEQLNHLVELEEDEVKVETKAHHQNGLIDSSLGY